MYHVVGFPGTRAFRVLWALEELDLPYTLDPVMPGTAAARAASPGMIPALRTAEGFVLGSVAILTFVADRHQRLTFPPGTIARARQDYWTQRIVEKLDAALALMVAHDRSPQPEECLPGLLAYGQKMLETNMQRIAADMGDDPWLAGEMFTIADIMLGHCLRWSYRHGHGIAASKLRRYLDRVEQRPAYLLTDSL